MNTPVGKKLAVTGLKTKELAGEFVFFLENRDDHQKHVSY